MAVQCNGGKQWLDIHFIKQIWSACHNLPDLWLFYWDHMKLGKKGQMPLLNPQNLLNSLSLSWKRCQHASSGSFLRLLRCFLDLEAIHRGDGQLGAARQREFFCPQRPRTPHTSPYNTKLQSFLNLPTDQSKKGSSSYQSSYLDLAV